MGAASALGREEPAAQRMGSRGVGRRGESPGLDRGPEAFLTPCPAHCLFAASGSVGWSP